MQLCYRSKSYVCILRRKITTLNIPRCKDLPTPLLRAHSFRPARDKRNVKKSRSRSDHFWKDCAIVNCRKQTNKQKIERKNKIETRPISWFFLPGVLGLEAHVCFVRLKENKRERERERNRLRAISSINILLHTSCPFPFLLFPSALS